MLALGSRREPTAKGRHHMKIRSAVAAAVLATGSLAACSSSGGGTGGSGNYCDDLKGAAAQLDALNASALGGGVDFSKAKDEVPTLAGEAPDAVKADWATLSSALGTIVDALNQAGRTAGDLKNPTALPADKLAKRPGGPDAVVQARPDQ